MGQPPPPAQPPRTQLLEPAYFRADPFQRTVMLDVAVAAYHGRAAGTTPPPATHPRRGRRVLFAIVASMALGLGLWSTYLTLVETEGGRHFLESVYDVIASPLL